jgi:hypothetical protein
MYYFFGEPKRFETSHMSMSVSAALRFHLSRVVGARKVCVGTREAHVL